jgi:hypothetical protein
MNFDSPIFNCDLKINAERQDGYFLCLGNKKILPKQGRGAYDIEC